RRDGERPLQDVATAEAACNDRADGVRRRRRQGSVVEGLERLRLVGEPILLHGKPPSWSGNAALNGNRSLTLIFQRGRPQARRRRSVRVGRWLKRERQGGNIGVGQLRAEWKLGPANDV